MLLIPTITVLHTPLEQSRLFSQDDIHLLESQYELNLQSSLVLQLPSKDKHTYKHEYCSSYTQSIRNRSAAERTQT